MSLKHRKLVWLLGLLTVIVALGFGVIYDEPKQPKEKQAMTMTPEDFEEIELNTFAESKCTPKVDEDFRGLLIASPKTIEIKEETVFPVCGTLQEGARFLNQFYSYDNEIYIVAVNAKTHQSYASNMLRKGFTAEPSKFDPSQEYFDSIVIEEWFNVDLFRYMEDLPVEPARYYVFAYLGERASNVVTVDLVKP